MLRSLISMAGATLARLLSGAVLMVFIARTLGPDEFGLFVLTLSLAMVLALLVEFGHSTFVMRELGRNEEPPQQLLARVLQAKALLGLLFAAGAVLVWASGWVSRHDATGFFCLCGMALVSTLADFLNVCFRGIQKFGLETRNVVASSIAHVVIVVPVALHYGSWKEIAVAFLVSRTVYFVLSLFSFKREFKGVGQELMRAGGMADAMVLIRQSSMYAVDAALVTVRSYADVFLISTFLGAGPLGLYQAGMNLVRAVENLGPIIANVFLPKLSGLISMPKEFERHERQLLLLLTGCGLFCLAALFLTPSWLFAAVFGERFSPSFSLFPIFGLYLLARFVAMALGVVLTARGFQSGRALAGLASLAVLVLVAWPLMAYLGVTAVAVANVVASLVLVAWFSLRLRGTRWVFRDGMSVATFGGIAALMAYLLIAGK
jgi:O-antigen/teichoic acid export membrane protein